MKIILYFLLVMVLLCVMLLAILFLSQINTVGPLSSLTLREGVYFYRFLLWQIYPLMASISILIISKIVSKKLFYNIYKKRGVFVLFFIFVISMSMWGIYHGNATQYWKEKISPTLYSVLFNKNNIEIRNEYDTKYHNGKKEWSILWRNTIGRTVKRFIIPGEGEGIHDHKQSLKVIPYMKNDLNLQRYTPEQPTTYSSVSVMTFVQNPSFYTIYDSGILQILFFISIGILLSINVLFLGIFQSSGGTIISMLVFQRLLSMIFFLFLTYKYIIIPLAFLGMIFFFILLIQNIKKSRGVVKIR